MENKGNFFSGVVIGTLAGALLGVLFAPASGHETRQKVAEKGMEVGNAVAEKAKEKSGAILEASREAVEQLKDMMPSSNEAQDALHSIEKELS